MAKITIEQTHAAYEIARDVHLGGRKLSQAAHELSESLDLNKTSSHNFINSIVHILRGEQYRRTINDYSVNYVLTKIYDESGAVGLRCALEAVSRHIEYFESISGTKRPSLRTIVAEHSKKAGDATTFESIERELEDKVRQSRQKTPEQRVSAIAQASPEPAFELRTVKVYIRNPDVRAEALIRANGICGSCETQAPFWRFEDGSPYLEVHHKLPLAEGGLDSLDNVIALCPNCHREAHYGQQRDRYRSL